MRKLKKLRIALFLLSVHLAFLSCSTEEVGTSGSHPFMYKVSKISENEFNRKPIPSEALNQIRLMQNSQSRNMVNVFNFMIDSDEITVIEKGDYISYTFPVYRDEKNELTENLVLSKEGDKFGAYLMKYSLDENDKYKLQEHIPIDVSTKTEVEPLPSPIDDGSTEMGTRTCWNITTVSEICCAGIHDALSIANGEDHCTCPEPPTEFTITMTQVDCPDLSTGPHGTHGGPTTGGGGSGGGSGGGGGVITLPVLVAIDHVAELKKLTDNNPDGTKTNIKTRIDALKATLATSPYEGGGMFNSAQEIKLPDVVTPTSTGWGNVPQAYYIKLHRHQDHYSELGSTELRPTSPVESDMDVYKFLELHNYTNNKNATDLFVSRKGTFALRVNNRLKANAAFNSLTNDKKKWTKLCEDYDNAVTKFLDSNPRDEDAAFDGFIKFIKETLVGGQPLGITLYQAVYDDSGNIIDWVEL